MENNYLDQVNSLDILRMSEKINENLLHCPYIPIAIAEIKIRELERLFSSGLFALHQGVIEDHKNVKSTDDNETAILWIRFEFLKSSILFYNSCVDYILQIINWGFNFYRIQLPKPKKGTSKFKVVPEITSRELYEEYLKDCTWNKIKEIFIKIGKDNPNLYVNQLYKRLSDFYEDQKEIRNLANKIKHKGGFLIEGLEDKEKKYSIFRYKGDIKEINLGDLPYSESNNSVCPSIFKTGILEINNLIERLIKSHKCIYEFSWFLYDFMGWENSDFEKVEFDGKELISFF